MIKYPSYDEAKKIVKLYNLKTGQEFKEWHTKNKPKNIPFHPERTYKNEWIDIYDFLSITKEESLLYLKNKGRKKGGSKDIFHWRSYDDAKNFATSLKFKSNKEWRIFAKTKDRPIDIPSTPDKAYKDKGWISWGEFLGTGNKFAGNFLSFDDAHKIILSKKIPNTEPSIWDTWNKFSKSKQRPENIPANPDKVYKNLGWISMLHWMTGEIETEIYSFEDAREYVRSLGFKNQNEWAEFAKSTDKPNFIPATPNVVYKNDWINLSDWIGSDYTHWKDREYISWDELNTFVKTLNLQTQAEWLKWYELNKPNNIPKIPDKAYKDKGWISWGDFLGTGRIADHLKEFISLEECKKFASNNNIKTIGEWKKHWKINKRPDNIPANPDSVYKENGWISWKSFFDTEIGEYFSYDEVKTFVQSKDIKSKTEWDIFAKSTDKPKQIPATPSRFYKDKGWISWGDFLGTGSIAPQDMVYLSYSEAKKIIQPLNLRTSDDWKQYCKSGNKPKEIPFGVDRIYKNDNFSWADFFGIIGDGVHRWDKSTILSFVKSLENELVNLDSVELITIINSNNLAKKISELGSLEDFISSEAGSERRRQTLGQIINQLEESTDDTEDDGTVNELEGELVEGTELDVAQEPETLAQLNPIAELHMYDNNMVTASLDDENIDFLMKNQLNKLWNRVINKEVSPEAFSKETGGERFTIIKNWFFEEYNQLLKLELPNDYNFRNDKGELIQPNLMQRLTVHRLINEKSYGNWSGTGAGKTLSAILAGRVADAKNTLIICNNATVEGWVNSINEYFLNNKIYVKQLLDDTPKDKYQLFKKYDIKLKPNENNYLVINYETFQQDDSEFIVSELIKNNQIDYIILDEVQNVKQREEGTEHESSRRDVVNKLIIASREKNTELLVLAMSATPIINNLTEPKKLIELLTSEAHNELDTRENIINGVEMYKALTRYGLRYRPKNGISVNQELIEIDGTDLIESLIGIRRGAVVEFEKVLLETKLEAIKDKIQKGTLLYTHYVTDLIYVIGDYVKKLGFSVGYYTGEDKTGLKAFKKGGVDVLIGSAPIGTGVDGIQKVCNTLIPVILPWTSSEYDQLVGRIDRQGSNFEHVNIYIPQVVIPMDDGEWSWDKRRFNIIRFKATLADLAVDGRIPTNLLPPKTKLLEDAKNELKIWLERLGDDNVITFEREEIKIPLNPTLVKRMRNELGEISQMHKEWTVKRSDNVNKMFTDNPEKWFYYHTLRREKIKSWSEDPLMVIASRLKTRPDWVVADFGCGENKLRTEISNKIHAFDHVAIDDSVIACDVSHVPLNNASVDVVVCCLSLWGSNWIDQVKEASRILKPFGRIFIAEKSSRWEGKENELKTKIEAAGFQCFDAMRNTGKFIYLNGEKI